MRPWSSCVKAACFIGKDSGPETLGQVHRAGGEKQDGKRGSRNIGRAGCVKSCGTYGCSDANGLESRTPALALVSCCV